MKAIAPGPESPFWWPARAIMGDVPALVGVLVTSVVLLGAAMLVFSGRFAENATAAAGISATTIRQRRRAGAFRPTTPAAMLRRKEWTLLRRDPWLVSQTLMQVLYLLPPALLLWRNFGNRGEALLVLVPVFVMAAGQLAGGLAWLAVSGEDAPDLVATAPVPERTILRAKMEAVMGGVFVVLAPVMLVLAFTAPYYAVVACAGVLIAAGSATAIQLWFRKQAKRIALPPPADVVARRDLCRGLLLDLVGGDGGPCRVRHLARHRARDDRGRNPRRLARHPPALGRGRVLLDNFPIRVLADHLPVAKSIEVTAMDLHSRPSARGACEGPS